MTILFLPLVNSVIILTCFPLIGVLGINCLTILFFSINWVLTINLLYKLFFSYQEIVINIGSWFQFLSINIEWQFVISQITIWLAFIVTSISFLIHLYSMYYMDNDYDYAKFLALLNLFTFFMLFLIFSSQLITIFIGWEGVGICSFLLINFWSQRQEASQSAIKAVLFNKIGDLSLLIAIVLMLLNYNSTNISCINVLSLYSTNIILFKTISLNKLFGYFLVLAAFGKSAQFFFHLWLTDAMEGPTPVSGLIHSATMVIAGIFLVIQTFPIIKLSAELLIIIMLVGTISTLITSLAAITSFDIKRVIANSTASHIGLMFMSLGLGDLTISLFHLTTHAYFKAFGFLFAGYLIHTLSNEQDCRRIGGFFSLFPLISIYEEYWCLTMLSLPNFSSYYSKELFFNVYWTYNQNICISAVFYTAFLMCFLSFICSSLYVGYLLSWFGDKINIVKKNISNIFYENNNLSLFILLILALASQLLGFSCLAFFNLNESYFTFNLDYIFYKLADWGEGLLLKSAFYIVIITLIFDYIEDFSLSIYSNKIQSIFVRINSFSLDVSTNWSLYSFNLKGLQIFYSIDNFIFETVTYVNYFKKLSFYLQKKPLTSFNNQLIINFLLVLGFLIYLMILFM